MINSIFLHFHFFFRPHVCQELQILQVCNSSRRKCVNTANRSEGMFENAGFCPLSIHAFALPTLVWRILSSPVSATPEARKGTGGAFLAFPQVLSAASSPQTPRPVLWAPVLLAHSNFSGSHCRWPLPALSPPSQYSGPQSCWICQYSRLLFAASVVSSGAAATFSSQKPKKVQKNH